MTNITDPQSVAFCNQTIRPLADAYGRLYNAAIEAQLEFTAKGLNLTIPNDGAAIVVADGSVITAQVQ
jgi:hypothetical protein